MDSTRLCTIEGCGKPLHCRGWCKGHYWRWQTHGDPLTLAPKSSYAERFEAKVDRSGECHRWTGAHNPQGYGRFQYKGAKLWPAHHVALILVGIEVPDSMTVDHVWARGCKFTDCVRVDHLEVVTNHENILRSNNRAANNARMTHCSRGHELAGDNLHIRTCGRRECLTCRRERDRMRAEKQRGLAA